MSTHFFALNQIAIKGFALICAVALLHCCIPASAKPTPPRPSWNDENFIPALRVNHISQDKQNLLGHRVAYNVRQLGAVISDVGTVTLPLLDYQATAVSLRQQLQDDFWAKHLLYLGTGDQGHMYAFPLNELQRGRVRMALLTIQARPEDGGFRDRTVQLDGLVDLDVADRHDFLQRLLGADGTNGGPFTHDLSNLFHNRVLYF
ncbi:uncharacterized protein UTRI_06229_B [Ustilago trichophora]|uniref:Uncharacterized protein n=1 Tax=Ustilago trichophora TaxID=86804 RepID=A0A5C3EH66_9BASI|nr:uncharacterized protein UTRI_06229_B [Ustilago trichophora]